MYNYLSKNGVLLGFLLAVLCIVILFIPIMSGLDAFEALPDKANERSVSPEGGIFITGIYVSAVLMYIAFGAAIVFSLFSIFSNVKASIKGLIAFGLLALLFFALYATADTEVTGSLAETLQRPEFSVSEGTYKMISGGITGTVWLMIVAFALMIGMEIWNFFKNA